MILYPNVPFVEGQIVTPDLLYTAYNPVFDGLTQYLGHQPLITDDSLSNAAGNIKSRLAAVTDNLKVSVVSGLTVRYASGSIINNKDFITLAPGTLVVPSNGSYYIYIDKSNTVRVGTSMPAVRIMLALVVANTTNVTTVFDLRSGGGFPILNPALTSIATFGGQGEDGAYNAINGDILKDGDYSFTSFSVPAGTTISVAQFAKIRVTGDVFIAGTINVTVNRIITGSLWHLVPGNSITGIANRGIGSRSGEMPAEAYAPAQQPFGSDGCTGTLGMIIGSTNKPNQRYGAFSKPAGAGGGGIVFDCAGNLTITGTGIINCNGTNGADAAQLVAVPDYAVFAGASSAGSGGYVALKCSNKLTMNGQVNAEGGNGGAGFPVTPIPNNTTVTWGAESGSGGGGGYLLLQAPEVDTTNAKLSVAGGASGAGGAVNAASFVLPNVCGGSFAGVGGTSFDIIGQPGGSGVIRTKLSLPSPS